jgi:hypothetical protein
LWEGAWPYATAISGGIADYIYPPLWIYTVSLLGPSSLWFSGLIIFTLNMATGPIVFSISYELTGDERRSIFAMLLYLLNPFILFYGSFLWLNPTPYVFFVTLSFYFALKGRGPQSILTLGVATLFKQFAVLFFPLLVLYLIKKDALPDHRSKIRDFGKHLIVYAGIILIFSIPFLLVNADAYLSRVLIRGYSPEFLTTFNPQPSWPLTFNTFFLWINTPEVITWALAYLLAFYILLAGSCLLVYVAYAKSDRTYTFAEALFWSIILVLAFQLFFPRGTYKFYLMILIPFISILFDYNNFSLEKNEPFSFKKEYLLFTLFSTIVFIMFRLVYFWILIMWLLFYLHKTNRFVVLANLPLISRQRKSTC